MTWRIFARTICNTKFANLNQWEIILRLFEEAGIKKEAEPLEKTIRSWLEGRRHCNGSRYFPSKEIDNMKVFQFLRKIPEEKLWNIQKEFRLHVDNSSPIDVNTDNLDLFCWSLVNQFLDLLGFLRVDIPDDFSPFRVKSTKDVHPYDKCCLYCLNWHGDKSTIGPQRIPTKGNCYVTKKGTGFPIISVQSKLSSSKACDCYITDQNFIERLKLIGYNCGE